MTPTHCHVQKNQENPHIGKLKRLKSPGFHNPHTMTRENLKQGIAAARVDLCRNLPDAYRLELVQWLEVAEGIAAPPFKIQTVISNENDSMHSETTATPDPQDLPGSREGLEVSQGLVYEVTPGHAEGWERVTLERTTQGVKVVVCQGHAQYKLVATPFVLEGLLNTIRRIARGELTHAKLGCVGWRALEVTARKSQVLA